MGSREDVRVVSDPSANSPLAGINVGARHARADIIMVLSGDGSAQRGLLAAILQTFDGHPEAGLVGAIVLDDEAGVLNAG